MSNCKHWKGGKNKQGYGQRWFRGKNVLAHRAAYCEYYDLELEDIKGVVIRHTCDTPSCVNALHLLAGTHQDNSDDMVSRGRSTLKSHFYDAELAGEIYQAARERGRDKKTSVLITASRLDLSEGYARRMIHEALNIPRGKGNRLP